jgi:putative hydrolase of the HAD superfamily
MKFDVFLTDLDNTLYDFAAAMERASQAVISLIGKGELEDLIRSLIFSPHGVESRQALIGYLNLVGIEDELTLKLACDEFEGIKNLNIVPFPGVVPGLQQIFHAGIRIGAVTNASSCHAEERLNLIGVRSFITILITPDTIGKRKPSPEVYQFAAEILNCPPFRICVLGDNLINDIAPAQIVGMCGIHARYGNRLSEEYSKGVVPDAVIDQFDDILPILEIS